MPATASTGSSAHRSLLGFGGLASHGTPMVQQRQDRRDIPNIIRMKLSLRLKAASRKPDERSSVLRLTGAA